MKPHFFLLVLEAKGCALWWFQGFLCFLGGGKEACSSRMGWVKA